MHFWFILLFSLNILGHGPHTGRCVPTDRPHKFGNISVCEVSSWCPIEDDRLVLGNDRPLITGSENHTVLVKNSIRFSYFGERFHRNNMPKHLCLYSSSDQETHLCNIFQLGNKKISIRVIHIIIGDIVRAAGGDYSTLATTGGVLAVHVQWSCNLDLDFMENCLPK